MRIFSKYWKVALVIMGIFSFTLLSKVFALDHEERGGHHIYVNHLAAKKIKSKEITKFKLKLYEPQKYWHSHTDPNEKQLRAQLLTLSKNENNELLIEAMGANSFANRRDGLTFHVKFKTSDDGYTQRLQQIIDQYDLVSQNGIIEKTDGLPSGDGDILSVEYISKENIYASRNNGRLMPFQAALSIYKLFEEITQKSGLNFTTAGSNIQIYDDATIEWLQGSWIEEYNGTTYQVTFKDNTVKIYRNNELTDDTVYTIDEGLIQPAETDSKGKHKQFVSFAYLKKGGKQILIGRAFCDHGFQNIGLIKVEADNKVQN